MAGREERGGGGSHKQGRDALLWHQVVLDGRRETPSQLRLDQ